MLDEIAELRAEVKRLQKRESEAKDIIVDALNTNYGSIDDVWARQWLQEGKE